MNQSCISRVFFMKFKKEIEIRLGKFLRALIIIDDADILPPKPSLNVLVFTLVSYPGIMLTGTR